MYKMEYYSTKINETIWKHTDGIREYKVPVKCNLAIRKGKITCHHMDGIV